MTCSNDQAIGWAKNNLTDESISPITLLIGSAVSWPQQSYEDCIFLCPKNK
uniref:Uncharacterized protein n=1 Tax=Arundo donax TaxID=35708 RepID=A0A0A9G5D8_ARUDO